MKVLYLAPTRRSVDRLAAFTFVDEEILALAKRGVELYILTVPMPGTQQDARRYKGVHFRELPAQKSVYEYFQIARFLWRTRRLISRFDWRYPRILFGVARIERFAVDVIFQDGIDLIHSNFGWPLGSGGMLAKAVTGRPLVTTMRGMDVLVDRDINYGLRLLSYYDRALRLLLKTADRTMHVSDFIRQRAIDLGAPESLAITVKKGVDCEQFTVRDVVQDNPKIPVILTVAGLIKRKGVEYILKALGELSASHDFRFVVVGDGPELSNLKALTIELGLVERTKFMGYVNRAKIQDLFSACDVFVLGSTLEASGNVLLEALASGRPVICTDSGGPPEYNADGVTGFVVPAMDARGMAEKIRILLDEPELREKFGRAARIRALEEFRYSRMIDDIIGVYRSVV